MNKEILNKLKSLEDTDMTKFSVSRDTGNLLNILIKATNSKKVLEAGTFRGYSGVWIAEALRQTGGHLTTVENKTENYRLANELFSELQLTDYITTLEGDAFEEMNKLDDTFDIVFIDGGRDYLEIFNLVNGKLLKENGLLAIDNAIGPKHVAEDVERVVQKMDSTGNYQRVTINSGGGLLLSLKIR
ncbi:O-methyltransferase [Patescibacteria group bacterium]